MTKLADVEGIGPKYAEKLTDAGIRSSEHLLEEGGTKKEGCCEFQRHVVEAAACQTGGATAQDGHRREETDTERRGVIRAGI